MSIPNIVKALKSSGAKFNTIIFDMCLMSMLETIYELKDVVDYVVAVETYGPWEGFISPQLLPTLESDIPIEEKLKDIASNYINRNKGGPDVCDVAVTRTKDVVRLANFIETKVKLTQMDFTTEDDTLDP